MFIPSLLPVSVSFTLCMSLVRTQECIPAFGVGNKAGDCAANIAALNTSIQDQPRMARAFKRYGNQNIFGNPYKTLPKVLVHGTCTT